MATKSSKTARSSKATTKSKQKKSIRQTKNQNWLSKQVSRLSRVQIVAVVFVLLFGIVGAIYTVTSRAYTWDAATWNTYAHGLRQCESGNNYGINTGNGYYGAYQFNHTTWASVGGTSYSYNAHSAPKAVQDYYAYKLFKSRGFQPWSCWNNNLYPTRIAWWGNPNHYASTGSLSSTATTGTVNPYTPYCLTGAESVIGYGRTTRGNCVKKLQWDLNKIQSAGLVIDGVFGPKTYEALRTFQRNKGLVVDGVCGRNTWSKLNSYYR